MSLLRQRRPREVDLGYLAWLRDQRCACGCLKGPPCDPAHLRAASAEHDKDISGMRYKPSDKWALPLFHRCHMAQHLCGDEIGWWRAHGVHDPFKLSQRYYKRYQEKQEQKHGRNNPPHARQE